MEKEQKGKKGRRVKEKSRRSTCSVLLNSFRFGRSFVAAALFLRLLRRTGILSDVVVILLPRPGQQMLDAGFERGDERGGQGVQGGVGRGFGGRRLVRRRRRYRAVGGVRRRLVFQVDKLKMNKML